MNPYCLLRDGFVCRLIDPPKGRDTPNDTHHQWVRILDGPEQNVERWYSPENLTPLWTSRERATGEAPKLPGKEALLAGDFTLTLNH